MPVAANSNQTFVNSIKPFTKLRGEMNLNLIDDNQSGKHRQLR